MNGKQSVRLVAPDILKIAASVFVIIIHHKTRTDAQYIEMRNLLVIISSVLCVLLGLFVALRKKEYSARKRTKLFLLPIMCFAGIVVFRKFAVAIFLIVSGYLLSGSMDKLEVREWYTKRNIIPRIMRFYIPFSIIFVIGLLYKIFVLKYEYSVAEVVARFILGGFKPGSYYITILAELVFVFPLIYLIVKKLNFKGVVLLTLFTFIYDLAATYLGMNPITYKFLIFRFTTHISFGVYAKMTEQKQNKFQTIILFLIGASYALSCMMFKFVQPKIFFQWQEASFPTAFLLYPVIVWFMKALKNVCYDDSKLSKRTMVFANATYHIFLVQLLYYTTFGFPFNEYVSNVAITMPLNILVTVPLGICYYKIVFPLENSIISKIKAKL